MALPNDWNSINIVTGIGRTFSLSAFSNSFLFWFFFLLFFHVCNIHQIVYLNIDIPFILCRLAFSIPDYRFPFATFNHIFYSFVQFLDLWPMPSKGSLQSIRKIRLVAASMSAKIGTRTIGLNKITTKRIISYFVYHFSFLQDLHISKASGIIDSQTWLFFKFKI